MRNLLTAAVVAAISLVQLGCNTSPEGGSPGTSDNFRIMGPSSTVPTTIKQGDKQTVKISLDRGKDFKKAITLKAEPSKGIHATFDKANVSASDPAEVNLTIEADKDASSARIELSAAGTYSGRAMLSNRSWSPTPCARSQSTTCPSVKTAGGA